jgi:uncharacterized protein
MEKDLKSDGLENVQTLKPSALVSRIDSLDIIRGIALLGILAINIPEFAQPGNYWRSFSADASSLNFWVDKFNVILLEGKMRALFSAVFGAGIILFVTNKEKKGKAVYSLFYQRMAWLVVFGIIHAYLLLWVGDILFFYGVIGMLAFLFHRIKPRYLVMGLPLVVITGFISFNILFYANHTKRLNYNEAITARETNGKVTPEQEKAIAIWESSNNSIFNYEKRAEVQMAAMKGSYRDIAGYVHKEVFRYHTIYFIHSIWDMLALMLLGMALFKWGFLTNQWTKAQYKKALLIGYGVGLPLVLFHRIYAFLFYSAHIDNPYAFLEVHSINWFRLMHEVQRIMIMIGHISVVILLYRGGYFKRLFASLRAVGQMAFTNYVLQTVLCSFVFYGIGLNFYGELEHYQTFYVVAGVWIIQLMVSPLWLKYYYFGPLEWLWRSLVYKQMQPFRRKTVALGQAIPALSDMPMPQA